MMEDRGHRAAREHRHKEKVVRKTAACIVKRVYTESSRHRPRIACTCVPVLVLPQVRVTARVPAPPFLLSQESTGVQAGTIDTNQPSHPRKGRCPFGMGGPISSTSFLHTIYNFAYSTTSGAETVKLQTGPVSQVP